MKDRLEKWLAHMHKTYGELVRRKSEDWLVGVLAIVAAMLALPPLYALVRAWWRLWVG